jgi:hypothetical protein
MGHRPLPFGLLLAFGEAVMSSIGAISGTTAYSVPSSHGPGASAASRQAGRPNSSGLEAALRQAQAAESQARRQLAAAMAQSGAEGPQVATGQAAVAKAEGAVRDAQAKLDTSKLAVDIIA